MVNVLMFQEYGATNSQSSQTSLISLDKSKEKPISLWRALLIPVSHQVKETKKFYILSHQVRKTQTKLLVLDVHYESSSQFKYMYYIVSHQVTETQSMNYKCNL